MPICISSQLGLFSITSTKVAINSELGYNQDSARHGFAIFPRLAEAPEPDAVVVTGRRKHRSARMPVEALHILGVGPRHLVHFAVVRVPEGNTGALAGRGEGRLVERIPTNDRLLPRLGHLRRHRILVRLELVD